MPARCGEAARKYEFQSTPVSPHVSEGDLPAGVAALLQSESWFGSRHLPMARDWEPEALPC